MFDSPDYRVFVCRQVGRFMHKMQGRPRVRFIKATINYMHSVQLFPTTITSSDHNKVRSRKKLHTNSDGTETHSALLFMHSCWTSDASAAFMCGGAFQLDHRKNATFAVQNRYRYRLG